MKNFRITFLALSRTTEMEIKSENDISPILTYGFCKKNRL